MIECENLNDHCEFHNEDELLTLYSFKCCGNCSHVFETLGDLIEAEETKRNYPLPGSSVFSTTEITHCPYCEKEWD
jgi:hypothetical protein